MSEEILEIAGFRSSKFQAMASPNAGRKAACMFLIVCGASRV
jgi:hypothetical protein